MSILKKLLDFLCKLFSKNDTINSINNSQISVHGGSFIQANATFDLSTKESAEEAGKQMLKILHDYYLVDLYNDKFKFYLNQSILILKLNDSQTKRKVLIELLA